EPPPPVEEPPPPPVEEPPPPAEAEGASASEGGTNTANVPCLGFVLFAPFALMVGVGYWRRQRCMPHRR
ncbi:MAG: chaplin, partial [Chloroflexaceae bacterium]|nr:chaplin [Chloroflexaceae bacterium]